MAFNRMAFVPETGLNDDGKFPSTPASEDEARGQIQGLMDQLKSAINHLMAALENADEGASGAGNIGIAPINGVTGMTIHAMIANLKTQLDNISAGSLAESIVETAHIKDANVTYEKMHTDSVNTEQLFDKAVTNAKINDKAVSEGKLGTIQTITLDTGDSLTFDAINNKIKLTVSGCTPVQLCPVIYSTEAAPAAGTYPAGTVYIQYVAS